MEEAAVTQAAASLVTLPPELLHQILVWIDPADVVGLPRVCRRLRAFVSQNVTLYHDVYLHHLVCLAAIPPVNLVSCVYNRRRFWDIC